MKMFRAFLLTLLVLLLTGAILTACGGTETTPTEAPVDAGLGQEQATVEPTEVPVEPTEAPTVAATAEAEVVPNGVTVEDQALAGDNSVTIARVSSAVPGWLVVHADQDGAPGPVAGYASVQAGENEDVIVAIDPAVATSTMYAMLHVDAGTEGEYEFPGDDVPARDAEGSVVTPPFQVELPAQNAVSVESQAIAAGNTVTIRRVSSEGAGWMVIHADQDGAPGPVIGYAPVEAGENEDVSVEVDPAAATETLYAMLHVDAGAEGQYEFPGDDVPATDAAGAVVVVPFEISKAEAPTTSSSNTVTIADSTFQPAELSVSVGSTVKWIHEGSFPHTVTADDGSFDSGTMSTGDTFEFTFEEAGEFAYYCQFHGGAGGQGMSGVIVVTAAEDEEIDY